MHSVDYRSQYYPSSNVQTSDVASGLSNDEPPLSEPLDPSDLADSSCAERHPRCMDISEQNTASFQVSGAALQTAGMGGHPGPQPIRAPRGRETTPLLRKAASFTVFSSKPTPVSVGRINYNSLTHPHDPNIAPRISTPVPSASIVEHRYNGKSTYGQTVSPVENHMFKRYSIPVPVVQLHRSAFGDRYALRAACIRICWMVVGHGPYRLFWPHHLLHVSKLFSVCDELV